MNAYQKAKVERSLTLLRYLRAIVSEVQDHCKKHVRQQHTVCTQEIVEQLAEGRLLYVVERTHTNGKEQYEGVRFDYCLDFLITSLEDELETMEGGKSEEGAA